MGREIVVHDELWKAEVIGGRVIENGETVRIRGIRGLTLLVEDEDNGDPVEQFLHGGRTRYLHPP